MGNKIINMRIDSYAKPIFGNVINHNQLFFKSDFFIEIQPTNLNL